MNDEDDNEIEPRPSDREALQALNVLKSMYSTALISSFDNIISMNPSFIKS